ncbi:MAG: hypothetical protein NZ743_05200, partial [Pseudomonadales bacterium]|nr:hypothetical protein [Pseudomonadales bacterium]
TVDKENGSSLTVDTVLDFEPSDGCPGHSSVPLEFGIMPIPFERLIELRLLPIRLYSTQTATLVAFAVFVLRQSAGIETISVDCLGDRDMVARNGTHSVGAG